MTFYTYVNALLYTPVRTTYAALSFCMVTYVVKSHTLTGFSIMW